MEVILLERVAKLGQIGDVVRVKDGFARNYLLRKGKALRATKENRSRFENMRVELEARNLEQKKDAEKIARKLDGQSFTVLRQAAEGGQLYGSVSPRDIAVLVTEAGFVVSRAQVALQAPIKAIGLHRVPISLHPEVEATISVTVARNYLLPQGKALRATKDNRTRFEKMKVELEARNLEQKGEAEKIAQKLDGQSFTVLRQAAEGGQLYGSVSPRDLALLVTEKGFAINRAQVALNAPIKTIGLHKVPVSLHPEVEVTINVSVARNADEAQRLARGEDVTVVREEGEEAAEAATAAAEAFFEPEVVEARRTHEAADETSPADAETEKK